MGFLKRLLTKKSITKVEIFYHEDGLGEDEELDNLLIQKTVADIAIFVLGDINDDMCYVAIGDLDGIHVYKNKINHNDTSLIDTLSETTMFYLIKKLKQNDYKFLV